MKVSDMRGILKKSVLEVQSVENPVEDYYVVRAKPEDGLSWRPGEHGIFTFPGKRIRGKRWRAFSLASVPDEGLVVIGTRIRAGASDFKKRLAGMEKGDKINMRGPFGWFVLREGFSPLVLVAGGVGITPVMALMKELEGGNERPVEIVYSSHGAHLFEEEIERIAMKDAKMSLNLVSGRDEAREKTTEASARHGNRAYYYVSGSPHMVREMKRLIQGEGVRKNRIISDPFLGY